MRETLDRLCQYQKISREEAKRLLVGIAQGEYDSVLVASFLTVFRMRNVTVQELLGFRDAMLELAIRPQLGEEHTIDLCGTGGDGKDTFNISTLASFVAAGAGVKVTKHGNVSVSSTCGSSDVLASLGAVFTNDEEVLKAQLQEANICYLHAPLFHPAMKNIAPVRKSLGVRTFFNLLGPLVNPALPAAQVIGVFSVEIGRLFHYLLSEGSQQYIVLHALDGYDEVSLTGPWRVFGRELDRVEKPEEKGFPRYAPEKLYGGTKEDTVALFQHILSGKGTAAQQDVVVANAAYGIQLGKDELEYREARERAEASLKSGEAKRCFERFIAISQDAGTHRN